MRSYGEDLPNIDNLLPAIKEVNKEVKENIHTDINGLRANVDARTKYINERLNVIENRTKLIKRQNIGLGVLVVISIVLTLTALGVQVGAIDPSVVYPAQEALIK